MAVVTRTSHDVLAGMANKLVTGPSRNEVIMSGWLVNSLDGKSPYSFRKVPAVCDELGHDRTRMS